jgi:hypothetical protein
MEVTNTLAYYKASTITAVKSLFVLTPKWNLVSFWDQFHKTFFVVIYAAIGILPYVLTRVMSLAA